MRKPSHSLEVPAQLRFAVAVLASLAFAIAISGSAQAETGGSQYAPSNTGSTSKSGGAGADDTGLPTAKERKRAKRKRAAARRAPVITGSKLGSKTLFESGRPLKLRYRVKGGAKTVRVRLIVRTAGDKYIKTLQLGVHRTGVLQTTELTKDELGVANPGNYKLRLVVNDRRGRKAARAAGVQTWLTFSYASYRFPVVGRFSFGGDDARFGAGRPGRTHQGQDLVADDGTPLVAPYAGKISWVKYQASGAGYYVVLDGDDGRDYVFMHLKQGSINVKQGDVVPAGKLLARVGSTGRSSGPHLHFEIWSGGPWQLGGKPIDPLPTLERWYASAPGGAIQSAATAKAGIATRQHLDDHSIDLFQ